MRFRIEVMHGVNLDMLGSRPAEHYGSFTLRDLEYEVEALAKELGLEATFFQTNSEAAYVERLHRSNELADGLLLNPGAWTHYSYAIADAVEIAGLPTVEVHISDVDNREEWRRKSVIEPHCIARIGGDGIAGYKRALEAIKAQLDQAQLDRAEGGSQTQDAGG